MSKRIVKERLEKRVVDENNYSIATYKDYKWMAENVEQVDDELIDFIIDTSKNIDSQVSELVDKINKEIKCLNRR